jgi:protein subunit release factor B
MANYFDKEKALSLEMARLGLREEDIIERFVRSSAPGGQNVNKTSTCVYLKHVPTGTEVKCQKERSQAQNRYFARELLLKKIKESLLKRQLEQKHRIEKLKRQRRKKPKYLKLRILEEKKKHAQKKSFRLKVRHIE